MMILGRYRSLQHSRLAPKRKQPNTALLATCALALFCGVPALAGEATPASNPPAAQTVVTEQAGDVVARVLNAMHARDARAAFAEMSDSLKTSYGQDAGLYMKAVRLKQHALYDHATYRILSTEQDGTLAIHKVELKARDGSTSLAIFRIQQEEDGNWRVEHIGVVESDDERGA